MRHLLKPSLRIATGALLLCCAHLASAQFMWVDAKGIKQFSDRPPPPEVPLKNILRAPKGQPSAATTAAADAAAPAPAPLDAASPAAPAAGKQALSLAERNADFLKRRQEQEKKEREDKTKQVAAAAQCAQARGAREALDASKRILRTDKNGVNSYMDDEERAAAAKRLDTQLGNCTSNG